MAKRETKCPLFITLNQILKHHEIKINTGHIYNSSSTYFYFVPCLTCPRTAFELPEPRKGFSLHPTKQLFLLCTGYFFNISCVYLHSILYCIVHGPVFFFYMLAK